MVDSSAEGEAGQARFTWHLWPSFALSLDALSLPDHS